METNNSRIEWIDIAKAISIIAMVFCHVGIEMPKTYRLLDEFIHIWHMPIFFILSGLVFKPMKYGGFCNFRSFIISRYKTLIVPYIIFGLLCTGFGYVATGGGKFGVHDILIGFVYNNGVIPFGGIQWFLTALFFTELLYVLINNVFRKRKYILLICFLILILAFMKKNYINVWLPFSIDVSLYSTFMFAVGVQFKNAILSQNWMTNQWIKIMSIIVMALLLYFSPFHVNMRTCSYEAHYSILVSIVLSLFILMLIKEYERQVINSKMGGVIRKIGQNTLLLLLLNASVRKCLMLNKICIDNMFFFAYYTDCCDSCGYKHHFVSIKIDK